jgi:hypothetical protein
LIVFFIFIFFSDTTIPLLHFLHPNPHDDYKLEGRKAIFDRGNKWDQAKIINF